MEIRRGIVKEYDSANHQADVTIIGSMATMVKAVPVAHHVGGELMVAGTLCGVLFFAAGDPGLVICTWDGAPGGWITSELIKDGEVGFSELAASGKSQILVKLLSNNQETTSGSWVDMAGTGLTVTVPSGQTADVLVLGLMSARTTSAGDHVWLRIKNSTDSEYSQGWVTTSAMASAWGSLVALWPWQSITGEKVFTLQWYTTGGTARANRPYIFAVVVPT